MFLQRYIYHPLGGSKHGLMWQTIASFSSFMFIGYWHGAELGYFVWAAFNWLGIVIESVAKYFMSSRYGIAFRYQIGSVMYRRICAMGGTFSVIMLIASNMVFLTGLDSTILCFQRMFLGCGWVCPLTLTFIIYCANQCTIDTNGGQIN